MVAACTGVILVNPKDFKASSVPSVRQGSIWEKSTFDISTISCDGMLYAG
jgi:hypothetical protein